jgi:hypothetical protein
MDALERGGIADPDEKRMVGHYLLRAPTTKPRLSTGCWRTWRPTAAPAWRGRATPDR